MFSKCTFLRDLRTNNCGMGLMFFSWISKQNVLDVKADVEEDCKIYVSLVLTVPSPRSCDGYTKCKKRATQGCQSTTALARFSVKL